MPFGDNQYSFGDFNEKINHLNQNILNGSNYKFDLGNFIGENLDINTNNMSGFTNQNIITDAKSFIDEDLRNVFVHILQDSQNLSPQEIKEALKDVLKRTVLYLGSECERQDFIGVAAEFDDLKKVLVSEYMDLQKVETPTIRNLMSAWDKYKPSVVFISCHGLPDNLFLLDTDGNCKQYNNTDFVRFFTQRSLYTECVILSACESLSLGRLITDTCKNVVCINRMVDISTARLFCNVYMEYLNDHSLKNNSVYEDAFNYAKSYVKFEGLKDAFSFEYLKAELIGN